MSIKEIQDLSNKLDRLKYETWEIEPQEENNQYLLASLERHINELIDDLDLVEKRYDELFKEVKE